jgi:hypothetical protein
MAVGGRVDLVGKRFGKLLVVEHVSKNGGGAALWRCSCACGAVCVKPTPALKSGRTKSCGCAKRLSTKRALLAEHPGFAYVCPRRECAAQAGELCRTTEGEPMVSSSSAHRRTPILHAERRERAGLRDEPKGYDPVSGLGTSQAPVTVKHISELDSATAAVYGLDPDSLERAVLGTNADEPRSTMERRERDRSMKRAALGLGRWVMVKAPEHGHCRCGRELRKGQSVVWRRAYPDTTLCRTCGAEDGIELAA